MAIRSWLFVPGDSETKLEKVASCGADAVIVDLEDAVAPHEKTRARGLAAEWLRVHAERAVLKHGFARWVRINAMDTPQWEADLAAVIPSRPDGIMLPKAAGPEQLRKLAAEIYELEEANGLPTGKIAILPLVSETPAAALTIPSYLDLSLSRLAGLTWGAEDLSAAIGASRKRDAGNEWTDAFRMVRATMLLTAHAIKVMAVDTLYADFRDTEGLKRVAAESYADGFSGMLAIHPAQVPIINDAYSPGEAEIKRAQAIVDAFATNPDAGALQLDGQMIDQPHLEQARKLLEGLR